MVVMPIPVPCSSTRKAEEKPRTAHFEAQYAESRGVPSLPATELRKTKCSSSCQFSPEVTPYDYVGVIRTQNYCLRSRTALVLERDLQLHTVGKRLPRLDVDVLLDNAGNPKVPQRLRSP